MRWALSEQTLSTLAQVYPVLLLALIWDSGFIQRLSEQSRPTRREDPVRGFRFWTKPRVRVFALLVTSTLIVDTGVALLTLNGLPQNKLTVGLLAAGLALALGTLCTRAWVDILAATSP